MKNRPEKFNEWNTLWNQWDDWLKDNNISPVEASLSFVLSEKRISKIVVGIDNLGQLSEIINVLKNNTRKYPNELSIDDIKLLNPSKWSAL